MATETESPSASELCSCSCHHEKEKKNSSLSDHVTSFSCDQYLIILILLAARACLLSYLRTHGGMPALSFLSAVYFLQSVSGWRHLDADQRRCRDSEARASDPTHSLPWVWLDVMRDLWRQGRDGASCRAAKDTESSRRASVDYQFKFFLKRGNSCSGATWLCSCDHNTLHTCTQMNTNMISEITVAPFYTETRRLGSFLKKKTCTS